MKIYKAIALLTISTLPGCAGYFSSEQYLIERDALIEYVNKSASCCDSFSELNFLKLESAPSTQKFSLNKGSQIMSIDGHNSFVLPLEIQGNAKSLDFCSQKTTSWDETGGYFAPVVLQLDQEFNVTASNVFSKFTANEAINQRSGICGEINLLSNTKYLIFHTNPALLSQRTASWWTGSRSLAVDVPVDVLSEVKLYDKFNVGFSARPNTPEGEFDVHLCKTDDRSAKQVLSETCYSKS